MHQKQKMEQIQKNRHNPFSDCSETDSAAHYETEKYSETEEHYETEKYSETAARSETDSADQKDSCDSLHCRSRYHNW